MGMFMASVSFHKPEETVWPLVKAKIVQWLFQVEGLNSNLRSEDDGLAIVSAYGDGAPFLKQMAAPLSKLIGGTAVYANCCDSDFDLLEVYQNGEAVEKCYIGEVFEEYMEFGDYGKPDLDFWKCLLLEPSRLEELQEALYGDEVFAEDNLRKLSELTGLPIFDDELVFAE